MIRLLVVGKDNFQYNRTAVLLAGLKANRQVQLSLHPLQTKSRKEGKELSQLSQDFDYVLVPAFRHTDMVYVKRWSQVPVIFDPLISKFSTKVIDYRQYYKALKYLIDFRAFRRADLLIADTECHRRYYHKTFRIPPRRSVTIPVGVNIDDWKPLMANGRQSSQHSRGDRKYVVGFYGSFVPLQGTSVILKAAKILRSNKEIEFRLIGSGYQYKDAIRYVKKHQLRNVSLMGWMQQESLRDSISEFDICLGIFGSSGKANAVVPNKIYHYAALGKAIITKDTPGIREVFDEQSIHMVSNSPEDLADAIKQLLGNSDYRSRIGKTGLRVIQDGYSHHHVAQRLVDRLMLGL